jgi:hypothetical protein
MQGIDKNKKIVVVAGAAIGVALGVFAYFKYFKGSN